MRSILISVSVFLSVMPFSLFGESYSIDQSHSKVEFEIPHLMISSVTGRFTEFEAEFEFDETKNKISKIHAKIKAASIDTANEKRDKHLRSGDFFDTEKHPFLSFESTKVHYRGGKPVRIDGYLSIRNIKKKVSLDFSLKGMAKDPWGTVLLVFEAKTSVNRKDYGLLWNKNLDGGGVLVGDEVQVVIKGQAKKK